MGEKTSVDVDGKLAVAVTCGGSFKVIHAEQVRTGGAWLEAGKAGLG